MKYQIITALIVLLSVLCLSSCVKSSVREENTLTDSHTTASNQDVTTTSDSTDTAPTGVTASQEEVTTSTVTTAESSVSKTEETTADTSVTEETTSTATETEITSSATYRTDEIPVGEQYGKWIHYDGKYYRESSILYDGTIALNQQEDIKQNRLSEFESLSLIEEAYTTVLNYSELESTEGVALYHGSNLATVIQTDTAEFYMTEKGILFIRYRLNLGVPLDMYISLWEEKVLEWTE